MYPLLGLQNEMTSHDMGNKSCFWTATILHFLISPVPKKKNTNIDPIKIKTEKHQNVAH